MESYGDSTLYLSVHRFVFILIMMFLPDFSVLHLMTDFYTMKFSRFLPSVLQPTASLLYRSTFSLSTCFSTFLTFLCYFIIALLFRESFLILSFLHLKSKPILHFFRKNLLQFLPLAAGPIPLPVCSHQKALLLEYSS